MKTFGVSYDMFVTKAVALFTDIENEAKAIHRNQLQREDREILRKNAQKRQKNHAYASEYANLYLASAGEGPSMILTRSPVCQDEEKL